MIYVRIIGSGNAFHQGGRGHSSVLVRAESNEDRTGFVLVDAGATALYDCRKQGVDTRNLEGICITHFHGDHTGGIPYIMLNLEYFGHNKEELVIAGPCGIRKVVESWLELAYPGHRYSVPIRYIECADRFSIGSLHFSACPVTHSPESCGYRISAKDRTIAISGDTALDEKLLALCNNTDLAIVETTLVDFRVGSGHIAARELVENLSRINARRIVATHIGEGVEQYLAGSGVVVAHDGMEIHIGS